MRKNVKNYLNVIGELSIPLITGVVLAILWVNISYETYEDFIHFNILQLIGLDGVLGTLSLSLIVNDVFMALFFGIAMVEVVSAFQKGGSLNPLDKLWVPLLGTLGGVLFPVGMFFFLNEIISHDFIFETLKNTQNLNITSENLRRGWGITTATDIALAWLFAKIIFGGKHPVISFLLLLAILDDAIGLIILAVFYSNTSFNELKYLLFIILGIIVAIIFRKLRIRNMWLYLLFPCFLVWIGLIKAHVHPALSIAIIIPFMENSKWDGNKNNSTMIIFEHKFKYFVNYGLFFFGLVNSGVLFSSFNSLALQVSLALIVGKPLGIFIMAGVAKYFGMKIDSNIGYRHIFLVGLISGVGLTVALFMSAEAYSVPYLVDSSKMGALFSVFAGFLSILLKYFLKIKKIT